MSEVKHAKAGWAFLLWIVTSGNDSNFRIYGFSCGTSGTWLLETLVHPDGLATCPLQPWSAAFSGHFARWDCVLDWGWTRWLILEIVSTQRDSNPGRTNTIKTLWKAHTVRLTETPFSSKAPQAIISIRVSSISLSFLKEVTQSKWI